jgi:nucleoid-associated protein YgaU
LDQKTYLNLIRRENWGGLILGAVVLAIIGLLIYNFVAGKPSPQPEVVTPTPSPKAEEQVPGKVSLPTTYTVVKGDHLGRISQKFYNRGDLWPAIAKENNLSNPSVIEAGTQLKIPELESAQKVTIQDIAPKGKSQITGTSYVVQRGDTLWDITQRAYGTGFEWTRINQANQLGQLPNGNPLIHAGNVLVIPR